MVELACLHHIREGVRTKVCAFIVKPIMIFCFLASLKLRQDELGKCESFVIRIREAIKTIQDNIVDNRVEDPNHVPHRGLNIQGRGWKEGGGG